MSVGYPFVQLQQLACQAIAINTAAGGAVAFSDIGGPIPALQTIYCQLAAATVAQGGAAAGAGNFQTIPGLQALILCQVQALATATGTASAVPADPYSALSAWNAIDCALAQILANVSGPAPDPPENLNAQGVADDTINLNWDPPAGPSPDSYNVYRSTVDGGPYTLLANVGGGFVAYDDNTVVQGTTYYYVVTSVFGGQESVYSNQASAEPLSDLQIFINALNVFAPDVLLVGDTIAGGDGDPVLVWPDSSGNGADAAPAPAVATAPTILDAIINGKRAVTFNGANDELEGAYVNNTALSSVFVVFKNTVAANGPTYVTTALATGGGDATIGQPVLIYRGQAGAWTNAYYGGPISQVGSSLTDFRLGVGITDGAFGTVYDNGVAAVAPGAYTGPLATTLYCLGDSSSILGGSRALLGELAFVMLFKSDQTANMAAISALINTYYGL